MSTHNICFCRQTRKISAFFRKCLICCYEVLQILVCPDFVYHMVPELSTAISIIDLFAREFFYQMHAKKLHLQQGE